MWLTNRILLKSPALSWAKLPLMLTFMMFALFRGVFSDEKLSGPVSENGIDVLLLRILCGL